MGAKLKFNEILGSKYGRLTVVKETSKRYHHMVVVECLCDCGNTHFSTMNALKKGNTKSCGCIRKEKPSRLTHGLRGHRLFTVWANIKQRCFNESFTKYADYGGRGITICNEWVNDFKCFFDWAIANGWKAGLEIDRINNNGNYTPDNCRFVTRKENMNNTRTNQVIVFNGISKTLSEWADFLGIKKYTLSQRINKLKMPLEKAFTKEKLSKWQKPGTI